MTDINEILKIAVENKASDIFILSNLPITYKIKGQMTTFDDQKLSSTEILTLIEKIYTRANRTIDKLKETGDDDFSLSVPGLSRFRISTYRQRGSYASVIRLVSFNVPNPKEINIPESVLETADLQKGVIIVTGPAGSGKTTTLACLIDRINKNRRAHIITVEDPLEYLHKNDKSIVSQREIETDTADYLTALRACLRQSPDVILLGEMRDYETIKTAMTAAETGHLLISTLHTLGSANTIDRIIDVFPPTAQQQIRVQLAQTLKVVISQQLLRTKDGGLMPVFEIMKVNNAIANMIREGKTHQIDSVIHTSSKEGMTGMDNEILELYKKGMIDFDEAVRTAINPDMMKKRLRS
ncbi:MAG: PilT/PilU family type 4a pilus ATPase [Clostridia bacterium]|nr:PilT/PilU family type 4a pilus ATPase [Clostridia bacterium]